MYLPASFTETDLPTLHDFIERNSFGLLVSRRESAPFASHLPFLLDRSAGPYGTLLAHVARANPQWKSFADEPALAIFSGPHAYVSPTWYETPGTVPTWNYVAVHAYGRPQLVEDLDGLLEILRRTVTEYESAMPRPWSLDESDPSIDGMLKQIVGFRIGIERLEGKWKLNQNHPAERRERVVRALQEQGGENATEIAELMRRRLDAGS